MRSRDRKNERAVGRQFPREGKPAPQQPPVLEPPFRPTFRANSFPKVTNLFCRLPLPALFHALEAIHLGDLMRFIVRPKAEGIWSPDVSRAVTSAPELSEKENLCREMYCFSL